MDALTLAAQQLMLPLPSQVSLIVTSQNAIWIKYVHCFLCTFSFIKRFCVEGTCKKNELDPSDWQILRSTGCWLLCFFLHWIQVIIHPCYCHQVQFSQYGLIVLSFPSAFALLPSIVYCLIFNKSIVVFIFDCDVFYCDSFQHVCCWIQTLSFLLSRSYLSFLLSALISRLGTSWLLLLCLTITERLSLQLIGHSFSLISLLTRSVLLSPLQNELIVVSLYLT